MSDTVLLSIESLHRKRIWIEQGFRDAKSQLRLDRSWVARPERIEQMMVLVAVVMLATILSALEYRRRSEDRDPQLTTKRRGRSLSVFRLGQEAIWLWGIPRGIAGMSLFTGRALKVETGQPGRLLTATSGGL